ncbi:MAG: hypothetical protein WBX25_03960 [Rhodomicrobium sp.]
MISPTTEERLQKAWAASIPKRYQPGTSSHSGEHLNGAIILPPPPPAMLEAFFASIKQHLTKDQINADFSRRR